MQVLNKFAPLELAADVSQMHNVRFALHNHYGPSQDPVLLIADITSDANARGWDVAHINGRGNAEMARDSLMQADQPTVVVLRDAPTSATDTTKWLFELADGHIGGQQFDIRAIIWIDESEHPASGGLTDRFDTFYV